MPFFDAILGLSDIFAKSKTELAKSWISERQISSGNICVIGDTIHDYQVAVELGCRCILVCGGHNSRQRLQKTGAMVIKDFSLLKDYVMKGLC